MTALGPRINLDIFFPEEEGTHPPDSHTRANWCLALHEKTCRINYHGFPATHCFRTTTLIFTSKIHQPNIVRAVFMWPDGTHGPAPDNWMHLFRVQGIPYIDTSGTLIWVFDVEPLRLSLFNDEGLALFLEMFSSEGDKANYLQITSETFRDGEASGWVDPRLGDFEIGLNGPRPDGTYAIGINHHTT